MIYVDGIALWAPSLPGWAVARAALRGEAPPVDPPAKRPAPELLPPAERRRAPDTVALALEVASAAVAASGRQAADLPSVFTSAHGDLGLTDALCTTLAKDATLVSPTRFHNAVHNAPAGYWTIATGSMHASTALSAGEHSFAAGLLEAATQCGCDQRAVLLAGVDVQACGALASTNASRGLLAVALVLSPEAGPRSVARLEWALQAGSAVPAPLHSHAARALTRNAMADSLPLFEALAREQPATLALPLGPQLALQLQLSPVD